MMITLKKSRVRIDTDKAKLISTVPVTGAADLVEMTFSTDVGSLIICVPEKDVDQLINELKKESDSEDKTPKAFGPEI